MKQPIEKISFNEKWAVSVTKEKFIEALSPAYPDNDLGAEYDKIVPPKAEKQADKAK